MSNSVIWTIDKERRAWDDPKTFECPRCHSIFTDEYEAAVDRTYIEDLITDTVIRKFEYTCPICDVRVIRKEKLL